MLLFLARALSQPMNNPARIEIDPAVKIGEGVLIGHSSGVVIGDNVKRAANAAVFSDLPQNSTAVGKPARVKNDMADPLPIPDPVLQELCLLHRKAAAPELQPGARGQMDRDGAQETREDVQSRKTGCAEPRGNDQMSRVAHGNRSRGPAMI